MSLLHLDGIGKVYDRGSERLEVLKNVSFSVDRGEFVAIMGPSGSGKSTLMNIIGCLDVPTSGRYVLDGDDISSQNAGRLAKIRLTSIGFIFQNFNLLPRLSAYGNVIVPLVYSGAADRDRRARDMLDRVGLGARMMHRPKQLSGGEMQRVAIARALINDPKVVLADEPTGNLDSRSGVGILKLFRELHDQGRTIIMVTHDHDLAKNADRIITLHDGMIQSDASTPR